MKERNALEICRQLQSTLSACDKVLQVHSVFASAVNFIGEDFFFSVVTEQHCLYPMSCRIEEDASLTEAGIRAGMSVIASGEGIYLPQAEFSIDLRRSIVVDLSICNLLGLSIPEKLQAKIAILKELVRAKGCKEDLSALVTEKYYNPCADAVKKRLPEFNKAMRAGDIQAVELAGALAGGGLGLTPSTDDLLVGYLSIYLAHTLAADYGFLDTALILTKAMGREAAKHTNLISGAFLKQCGRGLLSENMIKLIVALYSDSKEEAVRLCGERILEFGSTSGTDILTGVILALLNLNEDLQQSAINGGQYCGKA